MISVIAVYKIFAQLDVKNGHGYRDQVGFRSGQLLSAGTASASSRKPLSGVFGHVLFPQESTALRSKNHYYNIR